MRSPLHATRTVLAGAVVVALLAAGGVLLWNAHTGQPADRPVHLGEPGFREAAHEAGIRFRMAFLPNEKGEKFKVNL